MQTQRYERLGIDPTWFDPEGSVSTVEHALTIAQSRPHKREVKYRLVDASRYAAIGFYYHDDLGATRTWSLKLLSYMDDYLFGEWQDFAPTGDKQKLPPDRNWWLSNLYFWKDEWEACLAWGSALGEWEKLAHLATYFRDGVSGNMEQTQANYNWHLLVAGVLARRPENELIPYREKIAEGKGKEKREQLLLAFLDAIRSGSDQELASTSSEYFKYYLKTDGKKKEVSSPLMFDGSFLVHFAKRAGRTVPIPENIQDHLIAL